MPKKTKDARAQQPKTTPVKRGAELFEGPPVKFALTHKGLIANLTNLLRYAQSAQAILHSSATTNERQAIANLIADLNATAITVSQIRCPNPMFNVLTVDQNRLGDLNVSD